MSLRVLIIKASAMGDIIHALPVLDYLHKVCPGVKVGWAVEEPFKEILSGNPLLQRLHVIRTRTWRKNLFSAATLREVGGVLKALRISRYDMVFDIQGNLKSGMIARLSGSQKRFGFNRGFLQESVNALFTNRKIDMRGQDDNAGSRCLRVVSAAFEQDYSSMELEVDIHTGPEEDAAAERLLEECQADPVLLFHGGTTWQTKFWSEERWIELGKGVQAVFPQAMMLLSWGNASEKASAQRVAATIGCRARLLDRYSLKGITAVIKRVAVVVGGDTGLIHLAAAVGTPTVSYYRASDGSLSGPRGPKHIIVQSPVSCSRCFRTSCDQDSACRSSITADAVLAGIERLQPCFKARTADPAISGEDRS